MISRAETAKTFGRKVVDSLGYGLRTFSLFRILSASINDDYRVVARSTEILILINYFSCEITSTSQLCFLAYSAVSDVIINSMKRATRLYSLIRKYRAAISDNFNAL